MDTQISHPIVKGAIALGSFVAIDWLTTAGQICAALTAIALFSELVWKKVVKPLIIYLREARS